MPTMIDTNVGIRQAKKKWKLELQDNFFQDDTKGFLKFLRKSGERLCQCEHGYPKMIYEEIKTSTFESTKIMKIVCSVCGQKFYKEHDFSFLMLILGRKGGGKTVFVFMFADIIHNFDPYRKVKIWQCPAHLIPILHSLRLCKHYRTLCQRAMGEIPWSKVTPKFINPDHEKQKSKNEKKKMPSYQEKEICYRVCKFTEFEKSENCDQCQHFQWGKNYFFRIERLDEIEFNDIVIIDEGILSVNAKEALTTAMKEWEKFLAILRHKRCILFTLFQRFNIIKSMRELSDIVLYKSIPQKLVEDEKSDMILKKYGERIKKFKKWESLIASDHQLYDKVGMIYSKVPEWYTDEISMSYMASEDLNGKKRKEELDIERAEMIADWLIKEGYAIPSKKTELEGVKWKIKTNFAGLQPPLSSADITAGIQCFTSRLMFDGEGQEETSEFMEGIVNDAETLQFFQQMNQSGISLMDQKVYEEFCKGKSMTDFNCEPYNMPKQSVSEVVRKVGMLYMSKAKGKTISSDTKRESGNDAERKVIRDSWSHDGYAVQTIGSGGERGNIPSPDALVITNDGYIRPVQVKERNSVENHPFSPLTFNAEFKIANRLRKIAKNCEIICPHCQEKLRGYLKPDTAYLYVISKDHTNEFIKEPLSYPDNKKTIKVDWVKKQIIRQEPDKDKIKSPKILEFLDGTENIYWGAEIETIESESDEKLDIEKQKAIVSIDKMVNEVGIENINQTMKAMGINFIE